MHSRDNDKLFCRIAVSLGFINEEQASQALQKQQELKNLGQAKRIGGYLFDLHYLSREQVGIIIQEQYRQQATTGKQPFPMASLNSLIDVELGAPSQKDDGDGMHNLITLEQAEELQDFVKATGLTFEEDPKK